MSLIGNTITITTEFRSPKGDIMIDPTDLIFNVYDGDTRECIFTRSVEESERVSEGVYVLPYTIDTGTSEHVVTELKGLINGNPVVSRRLITRRWV